MTVKMLLMMSDNISTQPRQQPAATHVSKTRSCNYSLEAPDDE
jgi:hypothetical protein